MFDSVLGQGNIPRRKLGIGAALSIGLHVAVGIGVVWLSSRPEARAATEVAVVFRSAPPPPAPAPVAAPPPPPAGAAALAPSKPTERKPVRKKTPVVTPKEIPKERPPEATPKPEAPPPEPETAAPPSASPGGPPGVAGGVPGGVAGGVTGGMPGGRLGAEVVPFGEGMTRPIQIEGRDPQYTREALVAGVQGVMIVKCVITTEGRLERCRTVKPLPHMEQAVLEALATKRYKPVTFQGRPIAVDYVFQIRLILPR